MSISIQEHLRESVLKTALFHLLKNSRKSPERTARNIQELLNKFNPSFPANPFSFEELLSLLTNYSCEECLSKILERITLLRTD